MAQPDKILEQLQDLIQERIDQFNGNLPAVQQSAFNAILDLTSELEVGSDRRIKPSIKNVKLIAKIKQELQKIIGKTDFEASLDDLVKTYDDITRLQNSYFTSLIGKFKVPKVLDEIRNLSIEATKDAFSEDALAVNVIDPIRDILVKNITQGGSRDEFLEEVRAYILGKEGEEEGRLLKYSKTYTTTALNQYSRNYGSTLSDDLGFQWYQYIGTNKDTTRPFCLKLTEAKRNGCMEYIHKSQFEDLVKGIICGEQVPIYEKYNLPQGMIEGTNASNLRVNAGGWNCNHDFAGVPDVLVPQKYKDQLASGTLGGTPAQKQEAVQVATEAKIEKLVQQRDKIEEQITKLEEQPVQPVAEPVDLVGDYISRINANQSNPFDASLGNKAAADGLRKYLKKINPLLYAKHKAYLEAPELLYDDVYARALDKRLVTSIDVTQQGVLAKENGYKELPQLANEKQFEELLASGKFIEFRRGLIDKDGITVKEMLEAFKRGEMFDGTGIFGNGTYTDTGTIDPDNPNVPFGVALSYADGIEENVLRGLIPKDSKLLDFDNYRTLSRYYDDRVAFYQKNADPNFLFPRSNLEALNIPAEILDRMDELAKANYYRGIDEGAFATALGFDGIIINGLPDARGNKLYYLLLFNRTKTIIKD